MRFWKYLARTALGAGVLLLAGCGLVVITDGTVEPNEPLPAAAVVIAPWAKGSGVLVDRGEKLLVTAASLLHVDKRKDVEVVFPVFVDGKIKIKRDFYLNQAPRIKATVIASNAQRDLAVLRLESVPEEAVELKLAASGCKPGEHVRLIGAGSRPSQIWNVAESTIRGMSEQKLTYPNNQKVSAKMAELETPAALGKNAHGGPVLNDAGELTALISGAAGEPPQLMCVDGSEIRYSLGIVYRYLATGAVRNGEHETALALCDKALAMNPADPNAYNERGAALSFLDRYDDAIAAYSRAIELDPKLVRAYRNRGSAYLHKGDFSKAVDDCTRAIQLDSNFALAYKTRAQAYEKLHRTAEASADQEQLRELSKINWKATSPFPANWFPDLPSPSPG